MATRRELLIGGAALAASAAAGRAGAATTGFSDQDYRRAIVIDGLGGLDDPYSPPEATVLDPRAVADLRTSGLTMSHVTVNTVGNGADVWEKTIVTIAQTDQMITDNPEVLVKVNTTADIRRAKREGKSAVLYGTQDTSLVGADLDRLALLRGLGVRSVQLTYNLRNLSGDGSLEPGNAGLSKLGYATIARIEREKMLVDFSHGGQRTIAEGIAATTRPPIISHTGCRALHDNPRNVWDAEMKACADKGGVVGIYWMPFLVPNSRPSSADLVSHMDHVRNLCGEDHVSIGTDGILSKTVIDDKSRAAQKKFYEDRAAQGIAAPGEGADIFNIVADWDDIMRYRHLADGLSKACASMATALVEYQLVKRRGWSGVHPSPHSRRIGATSRHRPRAKKAILDRGLRADSQRNWLPGTGPKSTTKGREFQRFWIPISWDTPKSIPVKWWLLPDAPRIHTNAFM